MKVLKRLFGKNTDTPDEAANPKLLRAMDAVAKGDSPENRSKLYEALLDCTLLVPVPAIPDGVSSAQGLQTLGTEVQIQLIGIRDRTGVRVTPAFTDAEALKNFDPNTPYIGLKSIDLFRILARNNEIEDILINPFDPIRKMIRPGGRVTHHEIVQLAAGSVPASSRLQQLEIKEQEKVMIGLPANPPSPAMQELLRDKASDLSEVGDVYYFQMARAKGPSSTVIGVGLSRDVDTSRKLEIMQALQGSIRSELKADQFLDYMFLEGPFGDQIRKIGAPVFRR